MNIWLIQTGEPIPITSDVKRMRTALLAYKLVEKGHKVYWWVSGFDHAKKEWIFKRDGKYHLDEGIEIISMSGIGYRKNISFSRLLDHRLVSLKFSRLANKEQTPDLIVASMPPHDLAYKVSIFAERWNIPLIVDIRDTWPEIFLTVVKSPFKALIKKALWREFYMTRKAMQNADGLIAPTESFLEWGLKHAKRTKSLLDKVFYLGYKKGIKLNEEAARLRFPDLVEFLSDKFIVYYVGTLSQSYHNPSIIIDAAEMLISNSSIHFIISGDGELYEELQKKAKKTANVTMTGWLNHSEMEYILNNSAVGVCPCTKSIDIPTNKVFAYASVGLPIITSFSGELTSLITKNNMGFYYKPKDVNSLVDHIQILFNDHELYHKMSINSKRIYNDIFDAEIIYDDYADHLISTIKYLTSLVSGYNSTSFNCLE